MGLDKHPRPAYVVDVDEDSGKQLRGTVRSATKEKPKLQQRDSRPGKPSRLSHSDTGNYSGGKNSAHVQSVEVMKKEEGKLERRKSTSGSVKSPRKSGRPPSSHENRSFPKLSIPKPSKDDPQHFGIPTPAYSPAVVSQPSPMQIPIRPRALTAQPRPTSYHQAYTSTGGYGPPLSMSAYYQQPQIITPSYPPPSPSYMHYAVTQPPQPSQPTTPQGDYFSSQLTAPISRPLSARFDAPPRTHNTIDPINRTASAFGIRDNRRLSFQDQYEEEAYYQDTYASRASDGQLRRETIRRPSVQIQDDPDYIAMPPPPKPILRRPATEYPVERVERSERADRVERVERAERAGRAERAERAARVEHREREERPRYREDPSPRRPSANRHSVSYDMGKDSERVRVEPASNGRRRQSYYGQSASTESSGYEEKLNQAASYQADIGGPSIPLTAEVLRRQQRRQGGSSRSTKSSESRDESDYRKSATTRTTRSGSGNDDENVTIKVTGQARVMVGGAQIDCNDGGEIRIERQQKSLRGGSERSVSEYGGQRQIDDRRSRIDRPSGRTRMGSQHTYSRNPAQYQLDNYL